jgi:cytochrome P450
MSESATIGQGGHVPDHVPNHLVKQFDFRYAPEVAADPWSYFAAASEGEPVFWTPRNGGHWVVCGTQVVDEVFRRHELFSNGVVTIPAPPRPQSIPSGLDPPEHGKYRKILSQRLFSPKALAPIESYMHEVLDELCAEMLPAGRCEFIADFARPLPVAVVLKIMGLPRARQDEFCEWARLMFHGTTMDEHLSGYGQVTSFMNEWVAVQRDRLAAGDSADIGAFTLAMNEGRVDDRPLNHDEVRSIAMLLLGAGVDTMTAQMGHAMRHFAMHPEDRLALVEQPERMNLAVEELLRRYGIANITRVVARDQTYRGVAMKQGELVLCASAMFPDPMRVDFDRPSEVLRHTPFGAGPHICPGAWLARTMMKALIERLLPAMPELRLPEGAKLSYQSGVTIGLTRLPLAWDAQTERN